MNMWTCQKGKNILSELMLSSVCSVGVIVLVGLIFFNVCDVKVSPVATYMRNDCSHDCR